METEDNPSLPRLAQCDGRSLTYGHVSGIYIFIFLSIHISHTFFGHQFQLSLCFSSIHGSNEETRCHMKSGSPFSNRSRKILLRIYQPLRHDRHPLYFASYMVLRTAGRERSWDSRSMPGRERRPAWPEGKDGLINNYFTHKEQS
ncbi:hypothetical protein FKM82_012863 [Ascaphus truei]